MRLVGVLALAAAGLGGCTAARIEVPLALAATTQPVELTGMGFGQRGDFTLGTSSGTFRRHALSADDPHIFGADQVTSFFGNGSFRVQGADFDGKVEGECRYLEAEATAGPATVTTIPFRYRCNFYRNGQPLQASLILHAAPRAIGPLTAETRIGWLEIGGRNFRIEPIHHSPQLAITTSEPLGYRFVVADSDVGAIDMNGERKTIYAPAHGPDREAVLIGSLALSVLWKN